MGRNVKTSAHINRLLDRTPDPKDSRQALQVERAVLFTDIVGSSAYFERYGDQAGLAMLERHNRLLFPQVKLYQGNIVKTIGDAIMAGFPSAASAVMSAVCMQHELERHNQSQPEHERILVRIGINYGLVLDRGGDLFGDVVNAAARAESLANGGQILILSAVESQLSPTFETPRVLFDAVRLKGKQEPVEVYEVRWNPSLKPHDLDDSVCMEPGVTLGNRFEIVASLGEGGMGQVYGAFDHALGENVALKFIRPDQAASTEALLKFKSEIRLARSITHPNICRIHEFLEMEGKVFLSMEWVRGQTLLELLEKRGRLDSQTTIDITEGVCRGLQAAHDRGITHKDLKPANIMIEDESRRVILMDFGIAQLGRSHTGNDVSIEGTPEYMSPEHVNDNQVSATSDIYSLGIILYEMLCGKPPHTGNSPVAVAIRHLTSEPPPLDVIRPDLPQRINRAVHRCLQKDPKERFPDANSLVVALTGKHIRKKLSKLTYMIIPLLLTISVFTAILYMSGLKGPAAQSWSPSVLVSSRSVDSHARMSTDGRRIVFLRNQDLWTLEIGSNPNRITSNLSVVNLGDIGGLSWTPDDLNVLFSVRNPDGFEIRQVQPLTGFQATRLDRASGADLDHRGLWLAFSEPNSYGGFDLAIDRLDGGMRRTILKGNAHHSFVQPRWSPDGKQLAVVRHQIGYQSTRDIGTVEVDNPKFEPLTTDGARKKANNTDPTWTPDGKWILFASKRTGVMTLWQVSSSGGPPTELVRGAVYEHRYPDMSPDGKRIVFSTHEQQMDIALVGSDGRSLNVTQDIWIDRFPVFSPDGKQVAFRTQRAGIEDQPRSVVIFDIDTHLEKQIEAIPGARDFCWCGSNIFYAATLGENRILGRIDLETGRNQTLLKNFHRLWSPACNEIDLRVVFVGQRSKADSRSLWLLEADHKTLRRLGRDNAYISYPVFSPNARQIAYRFAPSEKQLGESKLMIQSARSNGRPRIITKDRSFQRSQRRIRFSADGQRLYYMEAIGTTGRLWSISKKGGSPTQLLSVKDIHTLDFDISPDGANLIYARVIRQGDIYMLQQTN